VPGEVPPPVGTTERKTYKVRLDYWGDVTDTSDEVETFVPQKDWEMPERKGVDIDAKLKLFKRHRAIAYVENDRQSYRRI